MKKLFTLILASNFIFFLSSFSQPTFTKRYNLPMTFAKLIEAAPDGGYYFSGGINADVIVGKIDSTGNLQWAKQIGFTAIQEMPYDMVVLANGNVVTSIRWYDGVILKTFVISFDLNGNLVFCKRYAQPVPSNFNAPNNLIPDGNGFCMAVGISINPFSETHFLKVDSVGNKISSAYLVGGLWKIFKKSSGDYISFAPFTSLLCHFNSTLVYQNNYASYLNIGANMVLGMIEISNGSYMVYGDQFPFIAKVNSQLQYEWLTYYDWPNFITGAIAGGVKIDANRIAFFTQGESIANKPCIFEIDTLGNLLNCKIIMTDGINPETIHNKFVYKNNRITFIYNLAHGQFFQNTDCFKVTSVDTSLSQICNAVDTTMITSDDIIGPGSSFTIASGTTGDSLVTDSLPVVNISFAYGACNDSTLSINSFSMIESDFNLFPNPFNLILNVTVNSNELSEVILYDIASRKLLQQKFTNSVSLNTKQLAKGIYIYEVRNKNGVIKKGKVVKH